MPNSILEVLQMFMVLISMDLICSLETKSLGYQYALTVIYMFTNYVKCVPLSDKSAYKMTMQI